jgi:membrane dipeptidase
MIVDMHMDVPYQLEKKMEDIAQSTSGDFDYPRAKAGALDVAFMAVYVDPKHEEEGTAKTFADDTIDLIESIARKNPDKFALARTPEDLTEQFADETVSIVIGMENGAPIEGDLANLDYFYDRGVRYITLAHSKCNHICDSSYDEERKWNGLSPFGKKLIAEMNRTGMLIDVSHVSDKTFYQVMELSTAPVVATHSSCRYFTPGNERNISDDMIKLLAEKGGMINISFGTMFLKNEIYTKSKKRWEEIDAYLEEHNLEGEEAREFIKEYKKKHPIGVAYVKDVADHIDHVVKLVGIDHVGLGSDFDGVGDSVPIGLEDVSCYPNLIYELLKKGYTDNDIEKICAKNFLRLWKQVRQHAKI